MHCCLPDDRLVFGFKMCNYLLPQLAEQESNETLSNINKTFAGWSDMLQRPQNTIAGNPIKQGSLKTEIFTCKSLIFDNKKTFYELKRVET